MRQKGELLELCKKVQCPVVAIHGDYDPHPSEGVREPLQAVSEELSFHSTEELRTYALD